MRLAFLGTTAFAVAVLEDLAASPEHRPALVVTPPDRPRGRGRRLAKPPAAEAAAELGVELHQTESVNLEGSRAAIAASGAEVGVVCAFGQLIREPLLSELQMLNVNRVLEQMDPRTDPAGGSTSSSSSTPAATIRSRAACGRPAEA